MRVYKNLSNRGFTLVELLVVIAIIAILFAVVLVAINPAQRFKDSRNARRLSDVQSIAGAATTYTADKRGTPPADIPDGQCIGTKAADDFSTQIPQGGASWWEFSEAVSPFSDSLPGNNPANASNVTYGVSGRFGSGVQLNGKTSIIRVNDDADLKWPFVSLETWVKLNKNFSKDTGSSIGLIDKGNYRLGLDGATGSLFFEQDQSGDPAYSEEFTPTPARGYYAFAAYNGKFYAGTGGAMGEGHVFSKSEGSNWQEVDSYPGIGTLDNIYALTVYNGKLFVGQGNLSSDNGKIYSFDGTNWKMEYDTGRWGVGSFTVSDGKLYAGAGGDNNTAEVFEYNGTSWKGLNFSGGNNRVYAIKIYRGALYVSTGGSNNAQLWKWDTSVWSQIAIPSATSFDGAYALEVYDEKLYIGLGKVGTPNSGQVDVYDGTAVSVSDPGASTLSDRVYAMRIYHGQLYTGYGGDGIADRKVRVFKVTGGVYEWSAYANIPANNNEAILSFGDFNGRFYMGQYDDAVIGASDIIQVGDGVILNSKKQKWNANQWYHIVALGNDGSNNSRLYINGTEDNKTIMSFPVTEGTENYLYLGSNHSNGVFDGILDNVIIYNIPLSADTIASHAGCYNLGQYLAPEYMGSLPIDPSSEVTDGSDTGYFISKDTGGVITITAPLTETSSSIPEIIKASR